MIATDWGPAIPGIAILVTFVVLCVLIDLTWPRRRK